MHPISIRVNHVKELKDKLKLEHLQDALLKTLASQ
jgi:hypothetical protein